MSYGFFDQHGNWIPQARPVRCVCGYRAEDAHDLDAHILASMHLPGDHAEAMSAR
jgi:hypothetical protein